jgi:glycosyltransferase involved in cell wall biosynthesis
MLVTNVWNESKNIEKVFRRVSGQTKKPKVWLWIDDGSTDGSADIIRQFSNSIEGTEVWIEVCPRKEVGNLDTIGRAYNKTLPKLKDKIDRKEIDYLAVMDVDSNPCPNY